MRNHAIKLALAILLAIAIPGCNMMKMHLREPEVSLVNFSRLPSDGILEQRFALRLRLKNPNDLRLHVKGLAFTFSIEGYRLMTGMSSDIPVINPYGEAEFTVQGSAHVLDTLRLFNELSHDPVTRFHYRLDTQIDLAAGWPSNFNLKREGEINLLEEKHK